MNTVLILFILSGRDWFPAHATVYPTEQLCQEEVAKYPDKWNARKRAVCIPELKLPAK